MDFFWVGLAIVLLLLGNACVLVPGIPGPIVGLVGLFVGERSDFVQLSGRFLWIMAVLAILITVADCLIPLWGTKRYGGSKAGVVGSAVGLLAGLFVLPAVGIVLGPFGLLGLVVGPFAGAFLGVLFAGKDMRGAVRPAFGSLIGFVAGTVMKFAYTMSASLCLVYGLL